MYALTVHRLKKQIKAMSKHNLLKNKSTNTVNLVTKPFLRRQTGSPNTLNKLSTINSNYGNGH